MRFVLSDEQEVMRETLHQLLLDAGTASIARAWSEGEHDPGLALWRRLAEFGVAGLAIPERWGGLGYDPAYLIVAFGELGHHAVPGPIIESAVAVPVLLRELGEQSLCETWLRPLAGGERLATLVHDPTVPYALDGDVAEAIFSVQGDRLIVYASEVELVAQRSVDPARRLFRIANPDAGERVSEGPAVVAAAAVAERTATLAAAAALLGAGWMLLESTTEYALQRNQFGRPIGEFQAVKHLLANVALSLTFARPLVHAAAVSLAGDATSAREVSIAKLAASEAAYGAARTALQVHGAIGYTTEHDLHLWLKKVYALRSAWGTPAAHRDTVARSLDLAA
jgi:alkylation response protein AidB-like acyl-CoA dehydrogenase